MLNARALTVMGLILAFGAGWRVNHYYRDSIELNIARAAASTKDALRQELQAISSASARQLEDKLEGIANAAPREIRTEVVKPVFTAVCVSPEFVRLYNAAADNIGRTLSGNPADQMPDTITEINRGNRK
ncbi:hypothetical protein M5U04_06930 [Xenorhabdus sp. XENO-1]|uniref:hypothetical protein n=1 Tax=Xenorhabdus bovienii TaxID=40576 RepID=UPI0020CA4DE9|nr:hypothetical protein [Xenorhabdus bovienii]MCP9267841.1 hypothetical protein [Xenorhabdus bovienii subsp. africana]